MVNKRIQRKRTKGWRMPPNTVSVTRPGRWGNPFKVGLWFRKLTADWNVWTSGESSHFGIEQVRDLEHSIELFRDYAPHRARRYPGWLEPLRGKDLACWCKEGTTCHADILLSLLQEN